MSKKLFVVIFALCVFSGLVFADTNGVWHYAKDIRGGTFGSDEGSEDFVFASKVNFSGNVIFGNSACNLLQTSSGGVIECSNIGLDLQGVSDRGTITNRILSVPAISDSGGYGIDASGSSWMNYIYLNTLNLTNLPNCNILKTSNGVISCGVDQVNDADANPTNEIQILSIAGNVISLSNGGGSITLPGSSEVDPIFSAHVSKGITATNIANWNSAYSWGNHATQGYLKVESDPTVLASVKDGVSWTELSGIPAGFADNTDNVDDADNNPNNERQQLTVSGATISISNGGSATGNSQSIKGLVLGWGYISNTVDHLNRAIQTCSAWGSATCSAATRICPQAHPSACPTDILVCPAGTSKFSSGEYFYEVIQGETDFKCSQVRLLCISI